MDTLRDEKDGLSPEAGATPTGGTPEAKGQEGDRPGEEAFLPPGYLAESAEAVPESEEAEQPEEEELPRKQRRGRREHGLRLGLGASVLLALVMFLLGGAAGYFGRPIISPPPTPEDPQAAFLRTVISKVRHFEGNANAPVTVIEFSDFQ